jgi:hypothetical protein
MATSFQPRLTSVETLDEDAEVTLADILRETILNLEAVEAELSMVKRRLNEHLKLAARAQM